MTASLAMALSGIAVCLGLSHMTSKAGLFNGRLLSRPLRRRFPALNALGGLACRTVQFAALVAALWNARGVAGDLVYWGCCIGLYLDDYLSDGGRGRRWLRAARNRVWWRMVLPAPPQAA